MNFVQRIRRWLTASKGDVVSNCPSCGAPVVKIDEWGPLQVFCKCPDATADYAERLLADWESRAPVPPPAHQPSDPLSVLGRSLQAVRDSIDREDRRLSELPAEDAEALEQIEERRKFVREQRLDVALCWLLREIWHYAAWSTRPDASEHLKLPLTNVTEEEGPGKVICFTMGGLRYQLRFKEWPDYGGEGVGRGELALTDETGKPWLALYVQREPGTEYTHWSPGTIEGFKPGEWAVLLTSMYKTIDTAKAREMIQCVTGVSRLDEHRKTFDLPQRKPPT